jgi:hypothetical protein
MSNYLENLIAKSFNTVEIARPRLASRFEALPQGASVMLGEIYPVEMLASVFAPENESRALQENPFELKRDLRLTTASELPEEKAETSVWRGNQRKQQSAEPQIPAQQTNAQNRLTLQSVAPQESEKAFQKNDSPDLRIASLKQPKVAPMPQPDNDITRRNAASKDRSLLQQEETNVLKESPQANAKIFSPTSLHNAPTPIRKPLNATQAESEREESNIAYLPVTRQASKINIQPQVAMRVEYQQPYDRLRPSIQQATTPQTEAQVTPTINVTIGRIEVRATTQPSAPKRKQPSAAPTMSLEEYLRRRNRGGAE